MAKTETQAAYSRKKGWNRSYTAQLVKEGVIKLVKGKVDTNQANAAIKAMADPARDEFKKIPSEGKNKPTSMATYAEAKKIKAIAEAGIKQLELKRKQGRSLDTVETERSLIELFTTIKTRLRAIANKSAQEMSHISLAKKGRSRTAAMRKVMLKEIDEVLTELSNYKLPGGKK